MTDEERDQALRQLCHFTSLAAPLLANFAPDSAAQLHEVRAQLLTAGLAAPLPTDTCACGHPRGSHEYGGCQEEYDCYCDTWRTP
ncbi:hypothetical protein ACIOD1_12860 [Streptomyces sp. NPDC088097]|uniref:hypothetical protein n=1 Tax=Streptomyces sp. NPDC088097 TaxID=3365823 RepID=UPI003827F2E8